MLDPINLNSPALMDAVPEPLARKLLETANLVKYTSGQIIHSRGDPTAGISIVHSGSAHAGVYGVDGSFIMTSILGPGHSFGEFTLFTNLPRTHDVVAGEPTEIHFLTAAQFKRLADENPSLLYAVLSCALVRSHHLLQRLDAISRLPVIQRTAHLLLSLTSPEEGHTVRYRQSDLASTMGVSRVTLNRALKDLSNRQLIELGYGEIRLLDRTKLSDAVNQDKKR